MEGEEEVGGGEEEGEGEVVRLRGKGVGKGAEVGSTFYIDVRPYSHEKNRGTAPTLIHDADQEDGCQMKANAFVEQYNLPLSFSESLVLSSLRPRVIEPASDFLVEGSTLCQFLHWQMCRPGPGLPLYNQAVSSQFRGAIPLFLLCRTSLR